MPHISVKTRVLTLVIIVANVCGNFSMKWGLDHQPSRLGATVAGYLRVLIDPWVALGILLLILWLLARMAMLSWADLSYVLPVTSVGYVLNAVAARIFLGEHMTAARWGGTVLIMAGMALVGSTDVRTSQEAPTEERVLEEVR